MDQPTSKEPRGPVSLRIKFRSASLDQFIERYAVDVSRGGIFIRTREPLPVGTQLRFDFQLQDAAPLLAGEGTIVWIRENDPARAGVTPGMGVRFDKLTPASQPVLEKILAEKTRREQAGAPAKTGPAGGMAVRRPSSTFSALDPAARAAQAASGPPRVGGLSPLGAQPRASAPATGSSAMPAGAQPRTTAPAAGSGSVATGAQPRTTAPAIGSDPFGTGRPSAPTVPRTGENAAPAGIPTLESSGAFGRPRSTTGMNAQRSAPAPSALFEKPTADDIDRALSVLTEVDGPVQTPVPTPVDFSSRVRRPTDAQPMVLEAAPDVGDAPKAQHRRPTDAQPTVLESAPDVGNAPSRRSGTRPLFSGTAEMKVPTVPVIPIGDVPEDALQDDDEDDATSAWVGSGPTRVGGSEPELPAPAKAGGAPPPMPATATTAASASAKTGEAKTGEAKTGEAKISDAKLSNASGAPALSLDAPMLPKAPSEAPPVMVPNFAAKAPVKKKGSGAGLAIGVVLLLAGGAAFYFLKGPGRGPVAGTSTTAAPAPAATPEQTAPAAAPEGTAPAAQAAAPDAATAAAPTEKPATGGTATPGTLRLRPEGETPKEPAAEPKPAEAAPAAKAEPKPERPHRKRRGGGAAEAAAAVADVTPTAPSEAPAAEAAKPTSTGHVLKITSAPEGAEVIVDGSSMGTTPFSSGDVDPALPHSVTVKKDGFEAYEHMIGGADWPHAKNGVRTLRLSAKLHGAGGEPAKAAEPEAPAEPAPGLGTTPASPKRE